MIYLTDKICLIVRYWCSALGLYSLSGKTSYRQISWSLEATRLNVIIVVSLWNLTGTSAAALPMCLLNFRAIGKVQTRISRLWDFTRSCSKTSYRLVNRGPGLVLDVCVSSWTVLYEGILTKHILWFHDRLILITHWGRDNMAANFLTTFSNAFSWMEIYKFRSRFHWSLFPGVKLTVFQHWFR